MPSTTDIRPEDFHEMTLLVEFALLFVVLCAHQSAAKLFTLRNVTIDTPVGSIRGRAMVILASALYNRERPSSYFYSFLGIPYAKPPVGELRFKPTEPSEPFEGTYDALTRPPACVQYAENTFPWYDTLPGQSEDCLYLNVWTPSNAVDGDESQKRAVKLYIHGGGWFTGGSSRMGYNEGHLEANDLQVLENTKEFKGLVLVTFNFRLGALGFLSSGTDHAPGNAGLHDILTAMNWVYNNIESFGGDPDNIVLFGQGSGAIAVSIFLTVPSATEYFNKLVLTGASIYTLKAFKGVTNEYGDGRDNNIKLADRLAGALGCSSSIKENPKDTVDCLKGVDASSLVKTLASFSPAFQQPPNVFLPQFGRGDFIPFEDPFANLGGRKFGKKDALLMFTSDEGSYLLTVNNPDVFGVFGEIDAEIDDTQAKSMMTKFLENFPEPDDLAKKLLGDLDTEPTVENRKRVYQAMGSVNTICPLVYLANDLANFGYTVYVEEKKVIPPYNPWAEWMGTVHFNNVQLDFMLDQPASKIPFVFNGQSYNVTELQGSASFYNKILVSSFIYQNTKDEHSNEKYPKKYNSIDRNYFTFSQFAKHFDGGSHSGLGGHFCEILKKYFIE